MSAYSFLPYLRQGIINSIAVQDTLGAGTSSLQERAEIALNLTLKKTNISGAQSSVVVTKNVKLKGPGDIIGINSQMIVKVSPTDWVTNMEPNYLPYIEFYDEDFPWRFTPAAAKVDNPSDSKFNKLRPWLCLVALEESEFKDDAFNGILPSIEILDSAATIFPSEQQTWAWAHVHVNQDLGDSAVGGNLTNILTTLSNLIKDDPDKAVSRILCPRKLKPNTGYHTFLIPTFETGRLAGLGQTISPTIDALQPSWTQSTPSGTHYPIYHRWFFKTGNAGDFESLVRLLQPRAINTNVGKRKVDIQTPGNPTLDYTSSVPTIGLQGVLHPPTAQPDAWPVGQDDFTPALIDILNAPEYQINNVPIPVPTNFDPIIAPPLYGRWHAREKSLQSSSITSDWLHEVNLDPRYRIFAGAGAEVIRKNQDKYMQIAWEQVGEVIEANKKIIQMQIALEASKALYDKHIISLSEEVKLTITGPIHTKVKVGANTVYKEVKDSAIPNEMFSGAFRRITNPSGNMMRSMGAQITTEALIQDVNSGSAMVATPYQNAQGAVPYNAIPSSQMTVAYTISLPFVSNFTISTPGSQPPANVYAGYQNPTAAAFTAAVASLHNVISSQQQYVFSTNPALDVNNTAVNVSIEADPQLTINELSHKQIQLLDPITQQAVPITSLDLILAAPQIQLPMYKELAALSPDWLMPGLNTIQQNSINLLGMSQKYIEAFMLGLNHEMGRELLWRGYPTDQRGTYFSFFWGYENSKVIVPVGSQPNLDSFKDIWPINQWRLPQVGVPPRPINGLLDVLGNNSMRITTNPNLLILTIRGELLRKYPGTVIYMQEAEYEQTSAPYQLPRKPKAGMEKHPVFYAKLEPDIYFLGFDVTVSQAQGLPNDPANAGYFFVFQERAGELRFGADEIEENTTYANNINDTWNNLNWGNILANSSSQQHIDANVVINIVDAGASTQPPYPPFNPDQVQWGENSASMAYILHQLPIKLNVHAKELIPV